MRNGWKTSYQYSTSPWFLWVDILDAGCFRPSVSSLTWHHHPDISQNQLLKSHILPDQTDPHMPFANPEVMCFARKLLCLLHIRHPPRSSHGNPPPVAPHELGSRNPDVGHVFIFRVRPAQGFIYELGKGISHEKWGFMVVGGGGRGGDGWRVTGEEVLLLLLLMMMMMMMMMMMLVMIVVMSVVVVVLLTIISNNADLKIMLHWWGIIDLSLGLKNIMNNVPLEKHIVLSEVRLAYLPTWCSISIAWKKGIPTHFQNHPITRSYRYPSSRYFPQCMGMRSSIAGSNDLNSSASVVIPEKMTSKTHVELRVAHLGN